MFIIAGLLKFGDRFSNEFGHLKFIQDLIETGKMGPATTAMIILSCILMAFGMVGICGTRHLTKPFLVGSIIYCRLN